MHRAALLLSALLCAGAVSAATYKIAGTISQPLVASTAVTLSIDGVTASAVTITMVRLEIRSRFRFRRQI